MDPRTPAISARRCTCRRWRRPVWTSSARLRWSPGILRCRNMRCQAIRFPCIVPGAHLPPHKSSPRLEVYFRAPAFLKASVTAILSGGLYPHKTQIILERDGEQMLKRLSISVFLVFVLVLFFATGRANAPLWYAGS